MYYIYDQHSTRILSKESKHWQQAAYKTMSAAQAALTRMQKKYEKKAWALKKSEFDWERARPEAKIELGPLYTAAIAEADYYHKNIEKFVTRTNMMSGKEYTESVNTPNYMSPASEAYWSM